MSANLIHKGLAGIGSEKVSKGFGWFYANKAIAENCLVSYRLAFSLLLSCLFLVLAGPIFLPKSVEMSFKGYTGVTAIEIIGKNGRETKTITDKNQIDRIFNKLNSYSGTWTRQGDIDFPFTLGSFNYSLRFLRGNEGYFERLGIGDKSLIFDYTTYKEIGKEEVKSLLEVLGI